MNSLPKTVTPTVSRLRFQPSPTAPESSTPTTWLPSYPDRNKRYPNVLCVGVCVCLPLTVTAARVEWTDATAFDVTHRYTPASDDLTLGTVSTLITRTRSAAVPTCPPTGDAASLPRRASTGDTVVLLSTLLSS